VDSSSSAPLPDPSDRSDTSDRPDSIWSAAAAGSGDTSVADRLEVVPVGAEPAPAVDGWDDLDADSPLPPRRPRTITPLTWVLAAALIGVGGFALGAKFGRDRAPASAAASAAGAGAAARAAAAGATTTVAGRARAAGTATTVAGQPGAGAPTGAPTGAGGFAGAGGGTFGTVKLVDGTNVYIQDASGNVVKVTTTPSAAVTVTKQGTAADLRAGDTVIVQGAADADGVIAATAITSTGGLGGGAGGNRGNRGGGAAPTTVAGG
jgi:hypothetical protein